MRRKARRWCFSATALLDQFEEGVVASRIGQQLGVRRGTIQRWRDHETFLDPYAADHFAIKLGKHPSQIWTDWFDIEVTD